MIKVAILDDHPMVAQGIISMLADTHHIHIVGVFHEGKSIIDQLQGNLPDVLLLDILMPDTSGKDLVPIIRQQYPLIRIIALTSLDAPTMVSSMMRRGCMGYLLKDTNAGNLVEAIEQVYEGKEYIEPALKEKMVHRITHHPEQQRKDLAVITKRELQVLQLLAEECNTQEIADRLFISFRTVENHRQNLLQKLDVKNTVGLVKVAIQAGII